MTWTPDVPPSATHVPTVKPVRTRDDAAERCHLDNDQWS